MPGIKLNAVKERLWRLGWIDLTSGAPYERLMSATGESCEAISGALTGDRPRARVQDAIAAAVGMNVLDLFGDLAWPRQASRAMKKRLEELEEAERKELLARLAPGGAVAQARERRRREATERQEATP